MMIFNTYGIIEYQNLFIMLIFLNQRILYGSCAAIISLKRIWTGMTRHHGLKKIASSNSFVAFHLMRDDYEEKAQSSFSRRMLKVQLWNFLQLQIFKSDSIRWLTYLLVRYVYTFSLGGECFSHHTHTPHTVLVWHSLQRSPFPKIWPQQPLGDTYGLVFNIWYINIDNVFNSRVENSIRV